MKVKTNYKTNKKQTNNNKQNRIKTDKKRMKKRVKDIKCTKMNQQNDDMEGTTEHNGKDNERERMRVTKQTMKFCWWKTKQKDNRNKWLTKGKLMK